MKKYIVFLLVMLCVSQGYSKTFLQAVEERYFYEPTAPRIGLEVELTGLIPDRIGQMLQERLGGRLRWHTFEDENLNTATGLKETYFVRELLLEDSIMKGTVVIKPEDNGVDSVNVADKVARTTIYEIVTPPIYYDKVPPLQQALYDMRRAGAMGTQEGYALAIQVNVEIGRGFQSEITAKKILSILRNYMRKENKQSIEEERQVKAERKAYIGPYSPGFMERIEDSNYDPTMDQLFFDFMYRQSLEVLGIEQAWTMPEAEARELLQQQLESKTFEAILKVVKWNDIRVSALLMYMFPDDWITQYLLATTWFHDFPILEFREANSDFELETVVREILALVQYSQEFDAPLVWDTDRQQLKNLGTYQAPRLCSSLFAE